MKFIPKILLVCGFSGSLAAFAYYGPGSQAGAMPMIPSQFPQMQQMPPNQGIAEYPANYGGIRECDVNRFDPTNQFNFPQGAGGQMGPGMHQFGN